MKAKDINLNKIAIRATDKDGEWGSFTLQELFEMGEANQIYRWFFSKIMDTLDIKEGCQIEEQHLKNMVAFLENSGFAIVKFK